MPITLSDNPTPGNGNTYDWTGDDQGTGNIKRYDEELTLAAAVEIRDQANHDYDLLAEGREATIIIYNGLDQALDVDIFLYPVSALAQQTTIYSANTVVAAAGVGTFSPYAGGAGASGHVQVAALSSPTYKFVVRISAVTAGSDPTSGTMSIYASVS